jgi:chromosome segregation ATPase
MSDMDELRERVSALESQMTELRANQQQTHGEARRAAELFAMVDRDVADLTAKSNAHTQVLQALRESQIEQGRDIGGLKTDMAHLKADVAHIKQDHGAKLERIVGLLNTLIESDGA